VHGGNEVCVVVCVLRGVVGRLSSAVCDQPRSVEQFTSLAGTIAFGSFKNFYSCWYTLTSMAISTWFVVTQLSWVAILLSLAYCALSAVVTYYLVIPVAKRTFAATAAFGSVRFFHARLQVSLSARRCCVPVRVAAVGASQRSPPLGALRVQEYGDAIKIYGGFQAEQLRGDALLSVLVTQVRGGVASGPAVRRL
jgi:hypothetical protein